MLCYFSHRLESVQGRRGAARFIGTAAHAAFAAPARMKLNCADGRALGLKVAPWSFYIW
jgi:hypothetical protein